MEKCWLSASSALAGDDFFPVSCYLVTDKALLVNVKPLICSAGMEQITQDYSTHMHNCLLLLLLRTHIHTRIHPCT